MFSLDLDRRDYQPLQIVRGTFQFELPEERPNLRVAVALTAMRDGEIVHEATRTLDGPKPLASGTYTFELRLPEDVKAQSLINRFKQAIRRSGEPEVTWEVWAILDREIVAKRAFTVSDEDEAEEAPAPASRASVLSRLSIPPPDYASSGRLQEDVGRKKKPVEPPTRDLGKLCPSCGAREEDPESQYCGRCGKVLS